MLLLRFELSFLGSTRARPSKMLFWNPKKKARAETQRRKVQALAEAEDADHGVGSIIWKKCVESITYVIIP